MPLILGRWRDKVQAALRQKGADDGVLELGFEKDMQLEFTDMADFCIEVSQKFQVNRVGLAEMLEYSSATIGDLVDYIVDALNR